MTMTSFCTSPRSSHSERERERERERKKEREKRKKTETERRGGGREREIERNGERTGEKGCVCVCICVGWGGVEGHSTVLIDSCTDEGSLEGKGFYYTDTTTYLRGASQSSCR